MTVAEFCEKTGFTSVADCGLDNIISAVYTGDLLSWVMAKAPAGCAWVTICGHVNAVAVAQLVEAACVIIAEGASVDADAVSRAKLENIPILTTPLPAFEVVKTLVNSGF